jgi:hypothetical protein
MFLALSVDEVEGEKEVKPGFACFVSAFTDLFRYFGSFPYDGDTLGPHTGCDFCSYQVDAVVCLC